MVKKKGRKLPAAFKACLKTYKGPNKFKACWARVKQRK